MNNGKKYNFIQLIKEYEIEIPKIQRDYIQGRKNHRVQSNRKKFVENLVECLKNNKEISLNFIYGIVENSKFIPIDGQQRLTTLLLLHLYVYAKKGVLNENKGLFNKFTYATRYTTHRFLDKLIENDGVIKNSKGETLSKEISEQWWYNTSWNDDINIRSCLAMLDEIDLCFKDKKFIIEDINVENLNNITFMFLKLEEFGSANELYIKMNSRGKQLTDFENFKAELYEKLDSFEDRTFVGNFKRDLDGKWAQFTFDLVNDEFIVRKNEWYSLDSLVKDADSFTKDLFHWVFVNFYYSNGWNYFIDDAENSNLITKEDFATARQYDSDKFWLSNYYNIVKSCVENADVDKKLQEFLFDYSNLLSLLCKIKNSDYDFYKVLKDSILGIYKIEGTRKNILIYNPEIKEYNSRILFYALTAFTKYYNIEKYDDYKVNLKCWFRVILNLVNNTETDSIADFANAIKAIKNCKGITDINKIEENIFLDYFDKVQQEEEIVKLKLINKNDNWKKAIFAAEGWFERNCDYDFNKEGIKYFKGQIYFLLHLASDNVETFINYSRKIFLIFGDENKYDVPFHRALLTYGDYKIKKGNKYTYFCYNESHHKYDWRGAFRKNEDSWREAVYLLKDLLSEWVGSECDDNNFIAFTEEKCRQYTKQGVASDDDNTLIYALIKDESKFKYINWYYYVKRENNDWILMSRFYMDEGTYKKLSTWKDVDK